MFGCPHFMRPQHSRLLAQDLPSFLHLPAAAGRGRRSPPRQYDERAIGQYRDEKCIGR